MDLPQNVFRNRLKAGQQQIGFWCTIPDPCVVEALAGAGFDWLVLDTEHAPVEPSALVPLLQAMAPYPTQPVVRPVVNDTALIKRHLDLGAQTLLLPMVNSRAEAAAAVAATRYAPEGLRGVATTTRAGRYGRIANYVARANAEICLLVQVETATALDRLEEIATTPGVDGIFFGPADLAASLGHPGQSRHPEVRKAVLSAVEKLNGLGVAAGILSTDPGFARECIAAGTVFTAVGIDMSVLVRGVDRLAEDFRA